MQKARLKKKLLCTAVGGALIAALALACGGRSRHVPDMAIRPTPTPTPLSRTRPTPRPRGTPRDGGVSPGAGAPLRDVSHEPLTRLIEPQTSAAMTQAIQTAERGRKELDGGTTDRAIELLDESIHTAPQFAPAYVLRARAQLAEGASASARADLDRAAKLSPEPVWMAEIIAVNGAVYEAQGNTDAAVAAYRRALTIYPGNAAAQAALKRLGTR